MFVTGAELSLFNHGFLPGDGIEERLAGLLASEQLIAGLSDRVNRSWPGWSKRSAPGSAAA